MGFVLDDTRTIEKRNRPKRSVVLPAKLLFELVRNVIVFDRKAEDVRIGVIVGAGGAANEQRIGGADVLMGVKDKSGNDHERSVQLGAVDFVDHAVGRRFRPVVVEDNLDLALTDENPIVMLMMSMPAFDFARSNGELINVGQRSGMNIPRGIEDFTEGPAIVHEGYRRPNNHAVNQRLNRNAFGRDRLNILPRLCRS